MQLHLQTITFALFALAAQTDAIAAPDATEVDCLGEIIETSSVTSLDFSTSTVKTNTLHLEGGELRYEDVGVVRDRAVSLVVTVASGDYTDIAGVWAKRNRDVDLMNGKNGNFGNINLQTVEGKPKSGEGNFKFCFHDSETDNVVKVDRFSFTVFDNDRRDGGLEEKMLIDASTVQSFQLWPNTEDSQVKLSCEDGSTNVPCDAGVRTIFHSSTIGYLDDNPTDPNEMNDLQKSRSIAFQFTDTDCFEFTYDHYCPSEQIDGGTPCEGYTGGNFLFGGSASEIITDGECVVTPTLAPTAEPTNGPTDEPTAAPVVPVTEPPIVVNGADDDANDDLFILPLCPEDITLLTTTGVTEWPAENRPVVEIISQDTSTVTVGLNQEWTSGQIDRKLSSGCLQDAPQQMFDSEDSYDDVPPADVYGYSEDIDSYELEVPNDAPVSDEQEETIDAIFYSYKENMWSNKCYQKQDVGRSLFDTVTISCNVLFPYALLEICVADNTILSTTGGDDAAIPKCCHSDEVVLPNIPTVCYSLEIRCTSRCTEAVDLRRMLRGSSEKK